MHLVGLVIADPCGERKKGVRNYVHPAGTKDEDFTIGLPSLQGKGLEAFRLEAKTPSFWPSLPCMLWRCY